LAAEKIKPVQPDLMALVFVDISAKSRFDSLFDRLTALSYAEGLYAFWRNTGM